MSDKIVLPNELLLSRAVATVEKGKVAIIPVKGSSMDPFIHGNKDCVELFPPENIVIGDIVLAKVNSRQYILHRVFKFEEGDGVWLMGDGNTKNQEFCLRGDIKAKALVLIKGDSGKRKRLDSVSMKQAAVIWRRLLPVRGLLLRIFRKLFR